MKGILNARTADVFTVFPGHIISHSVEITHANSEPIESSASAKIGLPRPRLKKTPRSTTADYNRQQRPS